MSLNDNTSGNLTRVSTVIHGAGRAIRTSQFLVAECAASRRPGLNFERPHGADGSTGTTGTTGESHDLEPRLCNFPRPAVFCF